MKFQLHSFQKGDDKLNNLIEKAVSGDSEAFIELIGQYKTSFYKIAFSILGNDNDVADAIQETILSCFQNITSLKNPEYFKTWATRILINKCNDIIRQNKHISFFEQIPEVPYNQDFGDSDFKHCLSQIDEKYRLIITLYYVNGFSVREISEMLSISQNTVKTRLSRARNKFKSIYIQNQEGGLNCEQL